MPRCCICNAEVYEGYYAQGDYYCSDKCLSEDFTPEEWDNCYSDYSDDFYYSNFED